MLGVGFEVSEVAARKLGAVSGLQFVSVRGKTSETKAAQAADRTRSESRFKYKLGANCSDVRIVYSNFYIDSAGSFLELGPGNAIELTEVALETGGSTAYVPASFSSIAGTLLADGDALLLSDPISATSLGLPQFFKDTQPWVRTGAHVPIGGAYCQGPTATNVGERVTISNATTGQVYATGNMVTPTGGSSSGAVSPVGLLGIPLEPTLSVGLISDSIWNGSGDNGGGVAGDGGDRGGLFARGLYSVPGQGGYAVPWHKNCRGGDRLGYMLQAGNLAKRLCYLPYYTDLFICASTNDMDPAGGNKSGAQALDLFDQLVSVIRASGFQGRIHSSLVPPYTTSTDGWATVANQTPKVGFETGGNRRDVYNAGLIARVGSTLHGVVDIRPYVADGGVPDRWPANQTVDGLHLSQSCHIAAAAAVSNYIGTLDPSTWRAI